MFSLTDSSKKMLNTLAPSFGAEERQNLSLLAALIIMLSAIPLLTVVHNYLQNDVRLYEGVADQIEARKVPYRDSILEYPPYAIVLFLPPRAFHEIGLDYQTAFAFLVLWADLWLKVLLYRAAGHLPGLKRLLPLFLYSVIVPLFTYWYLQRYDVFPALMTVLALVLFSNRNFTLAGVMVALATGVKLYPILLAPVFWILACKESNGRRFAGGVALGLAPLVVSGAWMPWWNFLSFHGSRGLQVESLYASWIWLATQAGWANANWVGARAWLEVAGPAADSFLPWAKMLFASATLVALGLSAAVARRRTHPSIGETARLILFPVLAFVAFNQVLSPQYMIWLLPLAALGA